MSVYLKKHFSYIFCRDIEMCTLVARRKSFILNKIFMESVDFVKPCFFTGAVTSFIYFRPWNDDKNQQSGQQQCKLRMTFTYNKTLQYRWVLFNYFFTTHSLKRPVKLVVRAHYSHLSGECCVRQTHLKERWVLNTKHRIQWNPESFWTLDFSNLSITRTKVVFLPSA